ncbi:unnamed protein product [Linum trigynum]|uniref:Uncharacterized protein n=1 Tax=Linum trigynum TaxID=586398 RepID=A0AAV2CZJ1_9ROSI
MNCCTGEEELTADSPINARLFGRFFTRRRSFATAETFGFIIVREALTGAWGRINALVQFYFFYSILSLCASWELDL